MSFYDEDIHVMSLVTNPYTRKLLWNEFQSKYGRVQFLDDDVVNDDARWDELLRKADWKAGRTMFKYVEPDEIDEAEMKAERPEEWDRYVEEVVNTADDRFIVKPSRYGLGLFAQRDLDAGETLPYEGKYMPDEVIDRLSNKHYVRVAGNIVGEVHKRRRANLAAFADDPGKFVEKETPKADRKRYGKTRLEFESAPYYVNAELKTNREGGELVLTKPVRKDDPIYVSYGLQYWGVKHKNTARKSSKKF